MAEPMADSPTADLGPAGLLRRVPVRIVGRPRYYECPLRGGAIAGQKTTPLNIILVHVQGEQEPRPIAVERLHNWTPPEPRPSVKP